MRLARDVVAKSCWQEVTISVLLPVREVSRYSTLPDLDKEPTRLGRSRASLPPTLVSARASGVALPTSMAPWMGVVVKLHTWSI